MARKIFHLYKKKSNHTEYYGSLTAVINDNDDLHVSKSKLDKYDFSEPFENNFCVLVKSTMKTTTDIKLKKENENKI